MPLIDELEFLTDKQRWDTGSPQPRRQQAAAQVMKNNLSVMRDDPAGVCRCDHISPTDRIQKAEGVV
jgi:hypothetical protein